VDRDQAIERLPEPYAIAVRLHEAGLDELIAERLGIASEAVVPLLEIAEAKLSRLLPRAGASRPTDETAPRNE
jgi:DNA-directed RNA polymerase specialized sigma24 family protein